ncbi:hypothetical protein [Microbacterium sp.]|uniref:hypothetical protein n=1 Tax=Microbacterium sp. TaxID=51671 RepID=UPI002FE05572
MSKFTVDPSGMKKLPITITVDLGRFATGVRDLSVAEARALADALHDLCDEVEAADASA